jgi:hypothetical protein
MIVPHYVGPTLIVVNVIFIVAVGWMWNTSNARSTALLERMAAQCLEEKDNLTPKLGSD